MSGNVIISVVTSGVTGLVAIVAILVSNQSFNSIGERLDRVESRLDKIVRTLEAIQSDRREFSPEIRHAG